MVLIPGATCLIRWQSHWHVVRQSWPFFQNDFAGRIANRVMQTAHALRDSVMASIRAVWYIGAYGVIACTLMAIADWRLGLPTLGLVRRLRRRCSGYFVPRMRDLVARELGGALAGDGARGRQLHQHPDGQALRARWRTRTPTCASRSTSMARRCGAICACMTRFHFLLTALNAALLVGTAAIGIWLWAHGAVGAGDRRRRAAARLAALQRRRLGELGSDRRSSRTSAWCRKACSRSRCRTRASTARARGRWKCRAARSRSTT